MKVPPVIILLFPLISFLSSANSFSVVGEVKIQLFLQALPFIEYELYNQLVHKLKVSSVDNSLFRSIFYFSLMLPLQLKGMNSIFGLRVKISVGEDSVVCLAVRFPAPVLFISSSRRFRQLFWLPGCTSVQS